jgi:hypothetical protein
MIPFCAIRTPVFDEPGRRLHLRSSRRPSPAKLLAQLRAKAQADLCFEPPVGQFNVFEWRSVDKIIEVGYRYALRKLDESSHPGVD